MRRGLCTMCDQSPSDFCLGDSVARDRYVVIGWTLARSAGTVQSCLCSPTHIHVTRDFSAACSEQSRSTSVLPINHLQCWKFSWKSYRTVGPVSGKSFRSYWEVLGPTSEGQRPECERHWREALLRGVLGHVPPGKFGENKKFGGSLVHFLSK